ncbi:hypothetical protein DH2020_007924 [Rehmannia glutinosa]|uniref:AIPP2-like SPOC-like domain-containing protein n=1 Tax=Rehmannia glutinosa TaxID=99300 RepID=A0ABR0TZJ1_REHGL
MNARSSTPDTICLQCGDIGFTNAFVFCVKCLTVAVHRYCLNVIPEAVNEFVHWVCDDCEVKVQNQPAVRKHDASRCQTKRSNSFRTYYRNETLFTQHVEENKLLDIDVSNFSKEFSKDSNISSIDDCQMRSEPVITPIWRSERVFDHLVDTMVHEELAMRADMQNAELLVFTSDETAIATLESNDVDSERNLVVVENLIHVLKDVMACLEEMFASTKFLTQNATKGFMSPKMVKGLALKKLHETKINAVSNFYMNNLVVTPLELRNMLQNPVIMVSDVGQTQKFDSSKGTRNFGNKKNEN